MDKRIELLPPCNNTAISAADILDDTKECSMYDELDHILV